MLREQVRSLQEQMETMKMSSNNKTDEIKNENFAIWEEEALNQRRKRKKAEEIKYNTLSPDVSSN